MKFAVIKNGLVENTIESDSQETALDYCVNNNYDFVVDIEIYAVGIGYTYVGGMFFDKNNNIVEDIYTVAEKLKEQDLFEQ